MKEIVNKAVALKIKGSGIPEILPEQKLLKTKLKKGYIFQYKGETLYVVDIKDSSAYMYEDRVVKKDKGTRENPFEDGVIISTLPNPKVFEKITLDVWVIDHTFSIYYTYRAKRTIKLYKCKYNDLNTSLEIEGSARYKDLEHVDIKYSAKKIDLKPESLTKGSPFYPQKEVYGIDKEDYDIEEQEDYGGDNVFDNFKLDPWDTILDETDL